MQSQLRPGKSISLGSRNSRLHSNEILMALAITAMENQDGKCYAATRYLKVQRGPLHCHLTGSTKRPAQTKESRDHGTSFTSMIDFIENKNKLCCACLGAGVASFFS